MSSGPPPLAGLAEPEELQGVEQQLEAVGLAIGKMQGVHRAVVERLGSAAVHTGEVVFVALHGREQGFAAGQVAAADQAALLQLPQMAVDRGQPHRLVALAQPRVQVLPTEFAVGLAQLLQQQLLAIARDGNLGRHVQAGRRVP